MHPPTQKAPVESIKHHLPAGTLNDSLASPLRTRQRRPRLGPMTPLLRRSRLASHTSSTPPRATSTSPRRRSGRTEAKLAPLGTVEGSHGIVEGGGIGIIDATGRFAQIGIIPIPALLLHPRGSSPSSRSSSWGSTTPSSPRSDASTRLPTLSGRSGCPCTEPTATDRFGGSVLDVQGPTVERVVANVEQGPGRLRWEVEVDEGPSVCWCRWNEKEKVSESTMESQEDQRGKGTERVRQG